MHSISGVFRSSPEIVCQQKKCQSGTALFWLLKTPVALSTVSWGISVHRAQWDSADGPMTHRISAAERLASGPEMLVETKLYAPKPRREWVSRDELVAQLAGASGRLLLVEAPAGFGKTTLVAQWHLSPAESRPFAWVSLDRGDNDSGRLWSHVAWALQGACPGFSAASVLA